MSLGSFGTPLELGRAIHLSEKALRKDEETEEMRRKTAAFHAAHAVRQEMGLNINTECIFFRKQTKSYHLVEVAEIPTDPKKSNWIFIKFECIGATIQWYRKCFFYANDAELLKSLITPDSPNYEKLKALILKKSEELRARGALFYKVRY